MKAETTSTRAGSARDSRTKKLRHFYTRKTVCDVRWAESVKNMILVFGANAIFFLFCCAQTPNSLYHSATFSTFNFQSETNIILVYIAKVFSPRLFFMLRLSKVPYKALFSLSAHFNLFAILDVRLSAWIIPSLDFPVGEDQVEQTGCEEDAEHHPKHESPLMNRALKSSEKRFCLISAHNVNRKYSADKAGQGRRR